jgi:hypothetical protein
MISRTTARRAAPNLSAELITDWATRVMGLWVNSRARCSTPAETTDEFGDACRVRDQLNNRLERVHPDDTECGAQFLDTLRNADAFFLQFTVESSTADALSRHDHYAHRGEWWWRRQTRPQAA